MTETQEYLEQYAGLKYEIRQLLEEQQRWRDLATRITPSYSPAPVRASGGAGKIQNAVEQIEEWEEALTKKISEQLAMRKEIETVLERVKVPEYRMLLKLRYINGYTWERVADETGYTRRHVLKMHIKALEAFKAVKDDIE